MRKLYKKIQNQSVKEIEKEILKLRNDISKERLNKNVNPPKDTNSLFKKRKTLAAHLTVLSEKKELEAPAPTEPAPFAEEVKEETMEELKDNE